MDSSPEALLLQEVQRAQTETSNRLHALTRDLRLLADAATQLRLGRSAGTVLARLREHSTTLLADWSLAVSRPD